MAGSAGAIRIEGATKVDNTSTAVASRIVTTSPAILHTLSIYNTGAAAFVQLFDSTTLPGDGTVPLWSQDIAATSAKQFSWPQGRPFTTGIVVSSSSTGGTKTIAGAVLLIDATYRPKL